MRTYIIRRLLSGMVILLVLSVVVFVLLRVLAGNLAEIYCGFNCTPEGIKYTEQRLGLDKPYFPVQAESDPPFVTFNVDNQYMNWVKDLATGHLGNASLNQKPILETMRHKLPVTLELLIITILFTVAVGIPFGVISALYRNSPADYGVRLLAVLGLAVPGFWIGTLVLYVPSQLWHYSPPFGASVSFFDSPWDNLRQYVPPAAVLSLGSAAGIMRLSRSSLLEVMRTDYIRTAKAKGLRDTLVVSRHALKNSMIPVITVLGLQIAGLLGGSVIVEQIFALPGLGKMLIEALLGRDYQVVQSMTIYIGATVILMNLLVDISYAWLDPRIRYS